MNNKLDAQKSRQKVYDLQKISPKKVAERLRMAFDTQIKRTEKRDTTSNELLREGYSYGWDEIAEELGITYSVVKSWETSGNVPAKHIAKLSAILNVSEQFFSGGKLNLWQATADPTNNNMTRVVSINDDDPVTETVITIPIQKPELLASNLGVQDSEGNGLSYSGLVKALTTDYFESRSTSTFTVKDPEHPRIPTWGFLITTEKFTQSGLLKGTEVLLSHKILPRHGDFVSYLTKIKGMFQVVSGYIFFEGGDVSSEAHDFDATYAYNYLATLPIVLSSNPLSISSDSIHIPASEFFPESNTWNYARRYLGVMVKKNQWTHLTSVLAQTDIIERSKVFDSMLTTASSTSPGKMLDLSPSTVSGSTKRDYSRDPIL